MKKTTARDVNKAVAARLRKTAEAVENETDRVTAVHVQSAVDGEGGVWTNADVEVLVSDRDAPPDIVDAPSGAVERPN